MTGQFSRDSAIPLYQQIKAKLIQDIQRGVLSPQTRLPSERQLVEQFGVSRITVRQALSELVQEGYLYTQPAKGFFVSEPARGYELNVLLSFTSAARAQGLTPGSRVLSAEITSASGALARQLLVPLGAEVVSLARLRLLNNVPVMVVHSWLSHARCPGILEHDLNTESLFAILREKYGLPLTHADTTISARLASAQEREWLELGSPDAVVTVDQVASTADGRPVEMSLMVLHPRRYPLSLTQSQDSLTMRKS